MNEHATERSDETLGYRPWTLSAYLLAVGGSTGGYLDARDEHWLYQCWWVFLLWAFLGFALAEIRG